VDNLKAAILKEKQQAAKRKQTNNDNSALIKAQNNLGGAAQSQKSVVSSVQAGINKIWELANKHNVKLLGADGGTASFSVDARGNFIQDYASIRGKNSDLAAFKSEYYASGSAYDQTYGRIDDLFNAKKALDKARQQVKNLGGVPAFARGGTHTGGFRIVGERGAELEATGPSKIYSSTQTSNMLGGNNGEEIRRLRDQVESWQIQDRQLGLRMQDDLKRMRDINERWEAQGLPKERT
jgi:trimeric autotransporter adhesin